jgi:hypothetical protein
VHKSHRTDNKGSLTISDDIAMFHIIILGFVHHLDAIKTTKLSNVSPSSGKNE